MSWRRLFTHCALFLLLQGAFSACEAERAGVHLHFVNPDKTESPKLTAELAVTRSEKQIGLMYRKSLAEDQGMLFIFPAEAPRSFWMKNTYVELDMVFLNAARDVVNVVERAIPLTESARSSTGPAKFVLEIGGGLAKKWGLAPGSKAVIEEELPLAEE